MSSRYSPPKDLGHYMWLSTGVALATIALKGAPAWLTGSVGLLSDAAESVVNLVAAVVALIVLKIATRPAGVDHQFRHSKTEYSPTVVEGVVIFVATTATITSAIERLIGPRVPGQLGVGLAASVAISLLNGAMTWVFYRTGRRKRSMTLVVDVKHLTAGVVTSTVILVGVALVAVFGSAVFDVIMALGTGPNIIQTGFTFIRDSVDGPTDIAPSTEVLYTVEEVLMYHRQVGMIDFHAVRVREAGNQCFMGLHVLIPAAWSVGKRYDFTEQVTDELIEVDASLRISVHLEPIENPKSYEDLEDI